MFVLVADTVFPGTLEVLGAYANLQKLDLEDCTKLTGEDWHLDISTPGRPHHFVAEA